MDVLFSPENLAKHQRARARRLGRAMITRVRRRQRARERPVELRKRYSRDDGNRTVSPRDRLRER